MSDSLLKKEFREDDLQRIRNLSTRKFNDKSKTSYGYQKSDIVYKEGDIFERDGKKYQIKNGITISVSKLDFIRQLLQLPFSCGCCGKLMKHKFDNMFFKIHKKCFNCVIEYETKLRIEGKYEEYSKNIINLNTNSFIEDLENELMDLLYKDIQEEYVTENGEVEKWDGNSLSKDKIKQDIKDFIVSLKSNNIYHKI